MTSSVGAFARSNRKLFDPIVSPVIDERLQLKRCESNSGEALVKDIDGTTLEAPFTRTAKAITPNVARG